MARKISDAMLDALLFQESGGDPDAVNERTGASGIAQIMEATALKPGFGVTPISLKDRFDPEKAIRFARSYMNAMLEKFDGNVAHALSAYNFGPGNVDKWIKSGATFSGLPRETRNYVVNILGNRGNAPPITRTSGAMLLGPTDDADEDGFTELHPDEDTADLDTPTLTPDQREAAIDAQKDVLASEEALEKSAKEARRAARVTAKARRRRLQDAAKNIRPGRAPAPNFRPAPSGGGGGRIPLKAAAARAVSAAPGDPLATQQQFIQGLLNPATSGGLLGARNLGATGLLSPIPRRT